MILSQGKCSGLNFRKKFILAKNIWRVIKLLGIDNVQVQTMLTDRRFQKLYCQTWQLVAPPPLKNKERKYRTRNRGIGRIMRKRQNQDNREKRQNQDTEKKTEPIYREKDRIKIQRKRQNQDTEKKTEPR